MQNRKILGLLLVCLGVILAGCGGGWGTDGPADQNEPEPVGNADDTDPVENWGGDDSDASSEETPGESDQGQGQDQDDSDSDDRATDGEGDDTSDDEPADDPSPEPDESDQDDPDDSDDEPTDEPEQPDDGDDQNNSDDSDDADDSDNEPPADDTDDSEDSDNTDDSDDDSDEQPDEQPEEPEEDPETHTLTVYAGEGVPASDVEITLTRESDGATTTRTTGSDGQVEFTVIDGEYTVRGVDLEGDTEEQSVTVDGEDTDVMLGTLTAPMPDPRTLTITVVDQNGDPVPNATVSGVGGRLPSGADAMTQGETNEQGVMALDVWEGMGYTLNVFVGNESVATEDLAIEGDMETTWRVELPDDPASEGSESETENTAGEGDTADEGVERQPSTNSLALV